MYLKLHNPLFLSQIDYYKSYRNTLNRIIKTAKSNYYDNIIVQNHNKPDRIWNLHINLETSKKRNPLFLLN